MDRQPDRRHRRVTCRVAPCEQQVATKKRILTLFVSFHFPRRWHFYLRTQHHGKTLSVSHYPQTHQENLCLVSLCVFSCVSRMWLGSFFWCTSRQKIGAFLRVRGMRKWKFEFLLKQNTLFVWNLARSLVPDREQKLNMFSFFRPTFSMSIFKNPKLTFAGLGGM